jgi:transglutaminase-like putative cysteine protease
LRVWLPVATEWDSQKNVSWEQNQPFPGVNWQDTQYTTKGLYIYPATVRKAGDSLVITDKFTYTCYEINYDVDPAQIEEYDKTDSQYLLYTKSESYIEANDAGIVAKANELKADQANAYDIAHAFYAWVMSHMTYQLQDGLKGAKYAFDNANGECGDYSCLFVALCRASGIPARPIVGRWATSVKNDWHVWAEFYLPGYGWIPVDPTVEDVSGGSYFGYLDNQRLIFNKQCNVVLKPSPVFLSASASILQTCYWEYQGVAGDISIDVTYTIVPASSN